MPIPRYERELQNIASRRFTRGVLKLYALGALIGLLIGLVWMVAGLLNFHVF